MKKENDFVEQKKLKIGVDIDEVLVDTYSNFLNFHNSEYNTSFELKDTVSFGMWKKWIGDNDEALKRFYLFVNSDSFKKMIPFEEAIQGVGFLNNSFELFAITSRGELMREETVQWISNSFKDCFKDVLFTNQFSEEGVIKTKAQICKELEIGILIEDRRKYALDCAENGIKVLLMDKPWNRENCEHENIIRVKDWEEVLEKIEVLENVLKKEKNIVEEVRKFVGEECEKHPLGNEILINHFIPMVDYSKKLAEQKNADAEVIEIAAWLHDVGSIIYGRDNHHLTGADIAEKKLRELNYPEDKIEKVKKCILNHRGSVNNSGECIEEQIIVEADCLICFDKLEGQFLWVIDGDGVKNQNKIRKIIRQKYINKYNQLSSEGKELIKQKYDAIILLLEEEDAFGKK